MGGIYRRPHATSMVGYDRPMFEIVQDHPCPYLTDQVAKTRYRLHEGCTEKQYLAMLERGWRRFGLTFFRPTCAACSECRSLRVDVETFAPNRSMRRNLRENDDLDVSFQPASLTVEHLELYGRYHDDMHHRREWTERDAAPADYFQTFVQGQGSWGHELLVRLHGQLVCVALLDVLAPKAFSAVYCYYDPRLRHRGLGVFAVLTEIAKARQEGIPHVYLGYLIEDNRSMRYKAKYRPHEILDGRPLETEAPQWQLPEHELQPLSDNSR